MYKIDFEKPIHIHFIGIGGISMSGLAEILLKEDGSAQLIRRAETPKDYFATFDCFDIIKNLEKIQSF